MTDQLKEVRLRIAKLEKEAKELRRLKSDCDDAKRFRKKLVNTNFD